MYFLAVDQILYSVYFLFLCIPCIKMYVTDYITFSDSTQKAPMLLVKTHQQQHRRLWRLLTHPKLSSRNSSNWKATSGSPTSLTKYTGQ